MKKRHKTVFTFIHLPLKIKNQKTNKYKKRLKRRELATLELGLLYSIFFLLIFKVFAVK